MQDHELTQDEFGEDFEADSFEFEASDELDLEAEGEGPEDEYEGSIGQTAAAAAGQMAVQMTAPRRKQSGRWVRRGNTVVLYGI
jgi:hypothetical protein